MEVLGLLINSRFNNEGVLRIIAEKYHNKRTTTKKEYCVEERAKLSNAKDYLNKRDNIIKGLQQIIKTEQHDEESLQWFKTEIETQKQKKIEDKQMIKELPKEIKQKEKEIKKEEKVLKEELKELTKKLKVVEKEEKRIRGCYENQLKISIRADQVIQNLKKWSKKDNEAKVAYDRLVANKTNNSRNACEGRLMADEVKRGYTTKSLKDRIAELEN